MTEQEPATCHLIEIAFDDIRDLGNAFVAIQKLLGEMEQIGTLSARVEIKLIDGLWSEKP